ncbi:MAG: ATP-binding protein [Chloroflexi bacterium]|nr:ATP-binding protein [Chloroflexota bacterium]
MRQKMPWWRSIRTNLILFLVVLIAGSVGIVTYQLVQRTEQELEEQAFDELQAISELKRQQIENWLQRGPITLETVARNQAVRGPILDYVSEPTADTDHQTTINTFFSDVTASDPIVEEISLYTLDGRVLASSDAVQINKVVTRQPYFALSLENDTYIQPPYFDVGRGELTLVVTRLLTDEAGNAAGVLTGRLNVDELAAIMSQRAGLGDTGETYLVSRESNYLLTPSRLENYPLNRAYRSTGIDRALSGESGSDSYQNHYDDPELVLGTYTWLPELQSAMLAEITEGEVLANSREATQAAIATGGGALILASLLGLFLATLLTRPILQLTDIAGEMSQGHFDKKTTITGASEVGLLGRTFNNMSERLSQTINELDQKVVEIETANKELRIANARAREATRLKSEFMATMSHELRTPLNAIIGFTGIMLQGMGGEIDHDATHMLTRVESNSERLLHLINDVLDIAKIEAGRLDIVHKELEIHKLIQQWRDETSILADNKGLEFEMQIASSVPVRLYADSERLTQVVKNLLSNAIKFTDTGKVTLNVDADENQWKIQVTDTGIGIPPHAVNYIFEEFRQVDGSSKRIYGGTGLGLSISRNICRMMGGNIGVNSRLGEGSTFTVTLPLITNEKLLEPTM